jgi:hypothetical protein
MAVAEGGSAMTAADIIKLGVEMRAAQNSYFKTRTKDALLKSKELESRFDRVAREYLEGGPLFKDARLQLDPEKIDWSRIEQETVRKLGLLKLAWEASFSKPIEMHRRMVRDLYVPILMYLAYFQDAMRESDDEDGGDA